MAQTKHPHTSHVSHSKHAKGKAISRATFVAVVDEELKDSPVLDAKKTIDIEAALEPAAIIDEKGEDDLPIAPTEDGEEVAEELSLDDDELNPFGDKWEQ